MAAPKKVTPTKVKKYKIVSNPDFQYQIHIGNRIKEVLRAKKIRFQDLADYLHISKTGLANKLYKPYFGTTFELIAICKYLDTDFISELLGILVNEGVNTTQNHLNLIADNKKLALELKEMENRVKRYEGIIDKLK